MKKQYTITIELQAENDHEAFAQLEEAVKNSASFQTLRHRLDNVYIEEYEESEYFSDEDQTKLFEKSKEEYEN